MFAVRLSDAGGPVILTFSNKQAAEIDPGGGVRCAMPQGLINANVGHFDKAEV